MLQKYRISIDQKTNRLKIEEFAVTKRVVKDADFTQLNQEDFVLLNNEAYDSEDIQSAVAGGKEMLISELRSDYFYPISPCAAVIADNVIDLYETEESAPIEFFFDDRDLLGVDEEN
jgi:hypothetical protein